VYENSLNEGSCCVRAVVCVLCMQSKASVWSVLLAALFLFALYLGVVLGRDCFLSAGKSSSSGPGGLLQVLMGDGGDMPEALTLSQFVS